MIRLIGRMPFAPTQTKMRLIGRMPIHGANAIRPYGRNSTGSSGFRATRTRRSFAACAFGANVCADRGFNRPVFKPKIQRAPAGFFCADRGFNRPVKLIRLYRLSKINTKTYN
jgi:hypothetical protein